MFVYVCVAVPDPTASQTSTDVSRGVVGSHSIEEAPGSSEAFSLPLGSVWAAHEKKTLSPILPQAQAFTKTTKVPLLLAALSAPLPSLKPPALPPLAADTAFTAGVL